MNLLNNKAHAIWTDYIVANYNKIQPEGGEIKFNLKCQLNSVHYAVKNNLDVYMCFYFENNAPILHFINYDPKKKKYIDNTLGIWCETREFYVVKQIREEEFFIIDETFDSTMKFFNNLLPWHVQMLSDTRI